MGRRRAHGTVADVSSSAASLAAPQPLRVRAAALVRRVPVFRAGAAAIALHVVDDAFVQPQPGTSASDHLVSGLVPLALLALAAWAYPRLRAGHRGALALALGVLGFAVGGEAFYYAGQTGLAGDDYTGLLALAAAPLLLGAGAHTLWRARRTDGTLPRRAARRALAGVAGVLAFAFLVVPVGMEYVDAHTARARVPAADLGAAARGRPLHHERRARAARLVRALAQRRRGDRLPRPQGPAGGGADARPPRLRRPALRPPRRGRERRRPQRLGLGRRPRPASGDRLPAGASRRRPRPHRRARPVRRRRADDRDRRRARRPGGRRLRGRRHPLAARARRHARAARQQAARPAVQGRVDRSRPPSSPARRRRRTCSTSSTTCRRPCCSCTRPRARAARSS